MESVVTFVVCEHKQIGNIQDVSLDVPDILL